MLTPNGDVRSSFGALYREHPRLIAVLLLLCCVQTLPIIYASFLPFVDLPLRVGELSMFVHWDDAARGLSRYYETNSGSPFDPLQILLIPLARLVGAEAAYRIAIAVSLSLIPLGMVALAVQRRFDPWSALLGYLLVHGAPLHRGQVNHWLGIGCAIWALVAWEQRRVADRKAVAVWVMWSMLTVLCSVQAYVHLLAVLLLVGLLRWFADWSANRNAGRCLLLLLIAQLPALVFSTVQIARAYARRGGDDPFSFLSLKLVALLRNLGRVWRGEEFGYLVPIGALLIASLAVAASRARQRPGMLDTCDREAGDRFLTDNAPSTDVRLRCWAAALYARRYLIAGLSVLVAYLFLPPHVVALSYAAERLPATAAILIASACGSIAGWRFWAPRLVALFGVGFFMMYSGLYLVFFGIEAEDVIAARDVVPGGARYRCHVESSRSSVMKLPVYRHFCGYVLAARGGLTGYLRPSGPWRHQKAYAAGVKEQWVARGWRSFPHDKLGDRYDYYLIRVRGRRTPYDAPPFASALQVVRRTRTWHVYKRIATLRSATSR